MAKLAFGVTGDADEYGEVTNVSVSGSADALDVTHHGSTPADGRGFIAGLVDPGEVTITGYCNNKTNLGVLGEVNEYTFTFPDGAEFTSDYVCTAMSVDGPVDGAQTFSVTLKAGAVEPDPPPVP